MLSKSSKCVHTTVSEKVLLTVHLHSLAPSWEDSISSDSVQPHTNHVESELEIVVVYDDLVD